jgi:hypothetical protein
MESRRAWAQVTAAATGVVLLLLLVRNIIDHPPLYDELLHVLAARGFVQTGEPTIADGQYDRAALFTRAVATAYQWFGDNLESARLPALLAALALLALVGSWVTSRAGLLAGTGAAVVLAMSITTIGLATFARFYTLHALAVVIMSVGLFEATAGARSLSARLLLLALAVLGAAVAFHLQITTLIAVGAVLCGLAEGFVVDKRDQVLEIARRRPWFYPTILTGVLALLAILEWRLHIINHASEVPLWAENRSHRVLFYVQQLAADLPLLWPLFPLAALAAIIVFGRFGAFCTALVVSALVVHSFAAAKSARYVYYALPFACAVMGCGLVVGMRLVASWVTGIAPKLSKAALPLGAVLLALVLFLSQEGQRTLRYIAGKAKPQDLTMYASETRWALAMPGLRPAVDTADVVIVSAGVKGLYWLGRYDFELNASTVLETESREEFGRDPRTGRPIIGTPESLAAVLAKRGRKLIVVDQDKLGRETGVAPSVVDLIRRSCEGLGLPSESGVLAWKCPTGER